jgi:hypothetical protein
MASIASDDIVETTQQEERLSKKELMAKVYAEKVRRQQHRVRRADKADRLLYQGLRHYIHKDWRLCKL